VSESAGEGGAWGIAILAAYMGQKTANESLGEFLAQKVFENDASVCVQPDRSDVEQFNAYLKRYKMGLAIEKAAVEHLK
jgi:sugar (pentulose or hexulose) kinase